MLAYSNATRQIAETQIVFSVDAVFQLEEDEVFTASVPTIWDNQILNSIDINKYDIYYVCTHPCKAGQYNSVTDFRKVWKLANLPEGIKDGMYDTDEGRIYWGVYKTSGVEGFKKHLSPTMILSSRAAKPLEPDFLYCLWKKYQLGFNDIMPEQLVNDLNPIANGCYFLHHSDVLSRPTLQIWGPDVGSLFS